MPLDFGHTTRPSVESRVTIYILNYYTVFRVVDIVTHDWNGLTATAHIMLWMQWKLVHVRFPDGHRRNAILIEPRSGPAELYARFLSAHRSCCESTRRASHILRVFLWSGKVRHSWPPYAPQTADNSEEPIRTGHLVTSPRCTILSYTRTIVFSSGHIWVDTTYESCIIWTHCKRKCLINDEIFIF